MAYHLIVRSDQEDRIYPREVAARLARMSLEMLELCEEAELIRARRLSSGGAGFTAAEIRRLERIRRLQDDLGLDLTAVEVVLHMRRRMIELLQEVNNIEQQMLQREQELHREIRRLRRQVSEPGSWE
jgi:DNA-binding transcriptional MerR regulator